MNGRVARDIHEYARARWLTLDPLSQAKIGSFQNLYKFFKEIYYQQGKSVKGLIKVTTG